MRLFSLPFSMVDLNLLQTGLICHRGHTDHRETLIEFSVFSESSVAKEKSLGTLECSRRDRKLLAKRPNLIADALKHCFIFRRTQSLEHPLADRAHFGSAHTARG